MGDGLVPENYGEYKILDPFENPASAQFHHRPVSYTHLRAHET